jgi:hypothetical protein
MRTQTCRQDRPRQLTTSCNRCSPGAVGGRALGALPSWVGCRGSLQWATMHSSRRAYLIAADQDVDELTLHALTAVPRSPTARACSLPRSSFPATTTGSSSSRPYSSRSPHRGKRPALRSTRARTRTRTSSSSAMARSSDSGRPWQPRPQRLDRLGQHVVVTMSHPFTIVRRPGQRLPGIGLPPVLEASVLTLEDTSVWSLLPAAYPSARVACRPSSDSP